MQTKSLLVIFAASLSFCACKKDLEPQESSVPLTPEVAQTQAGAPANAGQPISTQQMQVSPANATVVPQPGQVTQGQVAPGMNPAHGQPGHRCDIAVGAPLNSPAKMASQPAMTINPTQPTQSGMKITPAGNGATPAILNAGNTGQAAAPAVTAPGMNPPHGQPGHRCDIAVGAPLAGAGNATEKKPDAPPMNITVSDPAKTEEKKAE